MDERVLEQMNNLLELQMNGCSGRVKKSLEIVNSVCKEQAERGSRDFSIKMIGGLSEKAGGPKTQSIRNKEGKPYRNLINGWNHIINSKEKPSVGQNYSDEDKNLLSMITDPTIRACVGMVLSERKKLRGENNLLKQAANLIIDQRPHPNNAGKSTESLQSADIFNAVEWGALEYAISNDFFKKMGWCADASNGSVTREGRPVYRAGYLIAMKKILSLKP